MAGSQSPATLLGNRGTTPNTRDCLCCQGHAPTWACILASLPKPGWGCGEAGRGQQGLSDLPSQAQASQGCCPSNL